MFCGAEWEVVVMSREYLKLLVRILIVRRLDVCAMTRSFFENDVTASNNRTGVPVVELIPVAPIIANQAIFN